MNKININKISMNNAGFNKNKIYKVNKNKKINR